MTNPRKKNVTNQSKAQNFFSREMARRKPDDSLGGGVYNVVSPPFSKLLSKEDHSVDIHIKEAIDKGLMNGNLLEIRQGLFFVCLESYSSSYATYAQQYSRPFIKDQHKTARKIATELSKFMENIDIEKDVIERMADKVEDTTQETMDLIKTRSAIVEACTDLIDNLSKLISEPLPEKPNATNFEEMFFFKHLDKWWQKTCLNQEQRGANALRNRIAIALWKDMGENFPDLPRDELNNYFGKKFRQYCR